MKNLTRRLETLENQTNAQGQGTWVILDNPFESDKPSDDDWARLIAEQRRKHPGVMIVSYARDAAGVWQLA